MAISVLEKKGISREAIFVVPLDHRSVEGNVFDTTHRSDGTSLFDIAMALATAFAVVGASIGFKLAWGPIYWGLIATFIGFVFGLAIRLTHDLVIKKKKRVLKGKQSEIILIIDCADTQAEGIENILWKHFALGIAKIK
jgi:hypothetical protein